jgi:type IV secretory pathway TraG/TraD family ATPase VirD4
MHDDVLTLVSSGMRAPAAALAGVVAGRLLARALRARALHWSWALLAAAPLPVLASSPSAGTFACGVTALVGARRGCRWHQHDLDAGGRACRAARERRTPLDALSGLRRLAAAILRAPRRAAARVLSRLTCLGNASVARPRSGEGEGLLLGRDIRGRPVYLPLGGRSGRHAFVAGTTGSGKTVTLERLLEQALMRGLPGIVIDPKGDDGLRETVRGTAGRAGVPCLEWTTEGPVAYNPFAHGSDSEIADKALAGERYTEPHYLRQAQRFLGHAVRALRAANVPISLATLVRHMDPLELEVLSRTLPSAEAAAGLQHYLDSLNERQQRDLSGTRDRLAILAESDAGRWLDPERAPSCFDLLDVVRAGAACYVRLDADAHPLLAAMLGAALVQDLITTSAALQHDPRPALVLIDEFSAIGAPQVVRLFSRARSAGLSLVLATQELADLRAVGGRTLHDQVLGNLEVLVVHRQVVPESAELLAALAGTEPGFTDSERVHRGRVRERTRRREELPRVCPSEVSALSTGVAAVITPGREVRITRVLPPGC